ncbi:hypothetical protein C9374_005289 [Naegleria lovaniensis]|uniref:Cytochrome b5 heme-binding domain-containing protein n=1 Tax=Naegleria lovaniensis TaxID=51637 RepID=A0AA88GKP5_NAELO|nr:uncharacterized protein C9374_005289 [Naegleria lovaniensis]KAG2382709.1 hypothetical protein C9374_005289 [Naegleria lovaniensis]
MSTTTRTITKQELEEHNEDNAKAQWIVVDGKVYDITDYKHEHPGGEDILLEHAGADASEAFENVGHSKDARNRLKSLLVGELAGYKSSSSADETTTSSSSNEASSDSSMVKILLAVGVAVVLGGIYFTKIAQ